MVKRAATSIPAVGEGKRGPDGYLSYLLRQANASVRLALDRVLAEEGMTHPQALALTMIRAYEGLSAADLARLTQQTPQTVNAIVNGLAARGAIMKKPDGVHGRILRLHPTKEGLALNARCRVLTAPIEATLKGSLSAKTEKALRQWLTDVALAFGE